MPNIFKLTILCLLAAVTLPAQNLLPNPSFEEVNICTEYNAPCAPLAWLTVAPEVLNMRYFCNDKGLYGDHYVQLQQDSREKPDMRVYLQTRLLCPLQPDSTYRIRFYLNTENFPLQVGVRFDTAFIFNNTSGCLLQPASIVISGDDHEKKLKRMNKSWFMLEENYVATAAATHVIIGNFKPGNDVTGQLLIDSISITPLRETDAHCTEHDSILSQLYAERHRHSIPPSLAPNMVSHLGTGNGCDTLILKDDLFNYDHTAISYRYSKQVEAALSNYHNNGKTRIQLYGYSWQQASPEYNKIISYDRAKAVADYLVYNQGYSYDDFDIAGMGRQFPRYDTIGAAARDNNRVEMVVCHQQTDPPSVPPPDTLVLPDILFRFDSSELNVAFYNALDTLIAKIPKEGVQLQITGHTDNAGNSTYNYGLSLRRAQAVARYLEVHGLGNTIRQVEGAGEKRPIADNKTPEGRKKNRRVEIIIFHSPD